MDAFFGKEDRPSVPKVTRSMSSTENKKAILMEAALSDMLDAKQAKLFVQENDKGEPVSMRICDLNGGVILFRDEEGIRKLKERNSILIAQYDKRKE
ncbi:MAG: hypothetical protein V4699_00405 [Patescibacteria group bacterium]